MTWTRRSGKILPTRNVGVPVVPSMCAVAISCWTAASARVVRHASNAHIVQSQLRRKRLYGGWSESAFHGEQCVVHFPEFPLFSGTNGAARGRFCERMDLLKWQMSKDDERASGVHILFLDRRLCFLDKADAERALEIRVLDERYLRGHVTPRGKVGDRHGL